MFLSYARSDLLEESDQAGFFAPTLEHSAFISEVGSCQRLCLHFEVNFSIDVCCAQRNMTEPRPNSVDINTGAKQMACARVSNTVRADALCLERRHKSCRIGHSSAHQGINAEAREWLSQAVQEHAF